MNPNEGGSDYLQYLRSVREGLKETRNQDCGFDKAKIDVWTQMHKMVIQNRGNMGVCDAVQSCVSSEVAKTFTQVERTWQSARRKVDDTKRVMLPLLDRKVDEAGDSRKNLQNLQNAILSDLCTFLEGQIRLTSVADKRKLISEALKSLCQEYSNKNSLASIVLAQMDKVEEHNDMRANREFQRAVQVLSGVMNTPES
jgi:hypothetical protein